MKRLARARGNSMYSQGQSISLTSGVESQGLAMRLTSGTPLATPFMVSPTYPSIKAPPKPKRVRRSRAKKAVSL
ncbi:hypothetical protein KC19_VG082800 [Ceratodon purpureus]|uniref:Uncharacterized protein n=1 Tax=Ceratodon purpureus TaxID=3225 RepID=A0A8T0HNC4_CERPU|nr:hypothetical protein KC19_VG082800 [Ceratodon purpureus]